MFIILFTLYGEINCAICLKRKLMKCLSFRILQVLIIYFMNNIQWLKGNIRVQKANADSSGKCEYVENHSDRPTYAYTF